MKIPFVEHKNKPAEQHKVSTHSVLRFFTAKKIKNKFHGGDRRSRAESFSFIRTVGWKPFGLEKLRLCCLIVKSSSPRATRFSVFFFLLLSVPGSPHISSFSIVHREPNEKKKLFFLAVDCLVSPRC